MARFSTTDGVSLHYTDEGSGTPVLALPGLTRSVRDFDYVAPHLAGVRLIRLDSRGRGQSDWADPATYTIPVEAQDVLALLDHLGLDRVAILGTSRGGLIAMLLAATAKARLSGVALVDVGPVLSAQGLDHIRQYIGKPPAARTMEEAATGLARTFPGFTGVPDSRWLEEAQHHYRQTPDGLSLSYDPAIATAFNEAADAPLPDLWPLFDALDGLPLALIRGETSALLTVETAAEMARRRPDMIFATVPGRGHVPFLDEPEALAALNSWIGHLP